MIASAGVSWFANNTTANVSLIVGRCGLERVEIIGPEMSGGARPRFDSQVGSARPDRSRMDKQPLMLDQLLRPNDTPLPVIMLT